MSEYIIKNGFVFDPVQGIKGDKADVAIKDGKIVKDVSNLQRSSMPQERRSWPVPWRSTPISQVRR